MSLNKFSHNIIEVDGVRCSVVEDKVTKPRMEFLKKLLEHNGFEVKVVQNEADNTFTVAVTDILFNTILYIYERRLKTPDNKIVTPAYWLQKSKKGAEKGEPDFYWEL